MKKTDPIEIFQTIRAAIQPYAVLGLTNRENSDQTYDLWSEKNITVEGQPRNETFFASVSVVSERVTLRFGFNNALSTDSYQVSEIDDVLLGRIEDAVAAGYKEFKEKEWIA